MQIKSIIALANLGTSLDIGTSVPSKINVKTDNLTIGKDATGALRVLASPAYVAGQNITITGLTIAVKNALASLSRLATQVITANNTFQAIVFTVVNGVQNTTTNLTASPIVIQVAGTYRIDLEVLHDDNGVLSGSFVEQRILVNGVAIGVTAGQDLATGQRAFMSHHIVTNLAVGAVISAQVRHSTTNGNTVSQCRLTTELKF